MKAIVYHGPKTLVIEERPVPAAAADELIIKVQAVGICGSELEGYLGHSSIRVPPLVMGHEFSGVVAEAAQGAKGLTAGSKVIVNPLISCGMCDRCALGKPNICRNREIIGIHRPGAFAEYVAVPAANAFPMPQQMDASLASLAEPLAISIHAAKLGFQPFGDLLIFGAGTIGLLTLQVAQNMGVRKVMVTDINPARLQYAKQLGAEIAEPDQLPDLAGKFFSPGGLDTIIDCVGLAATREQAMRLVNPGGKVIMVGLGSDLSALPMNHLVRQEIMIFGSYTYTKAEFEQAIHLLSAGKIQRNPWSTIRGLLEAPDCFKALTEGKAEYSKIILSL